MELIYKSVEGVKNLVLGDPRACGASRSPKWRSFRDQYLRYNASCAVCGFNKYLNVHHIKPFHLFPELELIRDNLITLGEKCPTGNHHLLFGHFGLWKSYNIEVVSDASLWKTKIGTRP